MGVLSEGAKSRLESKLSEIKKLRPLPASSVAKLKEQFAIEMTYNSNAIEGNRLTLKETYLVISEGITIKGKSLKDHLEAKDHYEAIQFLYDLIEHEKRHTLSEHLIRSLQQMIVAESDPKIAGSFRTGSVLITGSSHKPPDAQQVPGLVQMLVKWMNKNHDDLHPVEIAALAHHQLVAIHPFFDGNGRTARLLMNLLLMQKGYPLVAILKNDRKRYYDALEKADKGDAAPLVRFVAQAVERSMNIYLKVLAPKGSRAQKYAPLSAIASGTPYSEKYLNLLVRQGKLEAHKEGRIWVTTKEALARYVAGRKRRRKSAP